MAGKYQKLAGKHVLIIGGTAGAGFCVAEASLESGASVTVSSSSTERVNSAVERLKSSYPDGKVAGYQCDLSKPTVEADIEKLFEQTGKVDHVVFTAGDPLAIMELKDTTMENILKAGQVRFFAPLLVAKVATKYLSPGPQSSIIITSGTAADRPFPGFSVVSSFAAGAHGMVRALALELAPIRVNCVALGSVDTELWSGFDPEKRQAMFKSMAEKNPTKHVGLPEETAEAYLWLMKDSNATGTIARSDSGGLLV
jgi:NAD(P)-dependent dehydrogenase (short-subunit alcohol dehydrogenase family)